MRGARSATVFSLEILDRRRGLIVVPRRRPAARAAAFRDEAGGHRWQRVPPSEKRGRVHTSTITVAVLPEPTEVEVRIAPTATSTGRPAAAPAPAVRRATRPSRPCC